MIDGDGLEALAPYFDAMLADLGPGKRRAVARKIGQQLRRANLARIASNVEPDGSAMEARKPRRDRRGRLRRKSSGKMFRKLRYARNVKVRPRDDGVEVGFASGPGQIAAVHHFGKVAFVGKTIGGKRVFARYPARRLLGFAPGDVDAMADELLAWLDRD